MGADLLSGIGSFLAILMWVYNNFQLNSYGEAL
uniref:Uncharacterized protein n=1 Tax=Anguilla anguilla TaxID=7936 RepID=A0A0E9VN49_ANGAN